MHIVSHAAAAVAEGGVRGMPVMSQIQVVVLGHCAPSRRGTSRFALRYLIFLDL